MQKSQTPEARVEQAARDLADRWLVVTTRAARGGRRVHGRRAGDGKGWASGRCS